MDVEDDIPGGLQMIMDEIETDEATFNLMMDSSSSEEEANWGGAREGKAPNKERDFHQAYERVVRNYFNGRDSKYNEVDFERRFRCSRAIFNRIHDALMGKGPFVQKEDASKKKGIYPLVKLVGCFRYIAYGDSYDRDDENLEMGESTLRVYTKAFAKLIIKEF